MCVCVWQPDLQRTKTGRVNYVPAKHWQLLSGQWLIIRPHSNLKQNGKSYYFALQRTGRETQAMYISGRVKKNSRREWIQFPFTYQETWVSYFLVLSGMLYPLLISVLREKNSYAHFSNSCHTRKRVRTWGEGVTHTLKKAQMCPTPC